ncbi:Fic family protein [Aquimarina sp. ERC-38]|uniref:Fic family protein n=1 Tax=Aquimarina sp. ERC-38 TaxID=2949996 RepID=UPI0022469414|nr:Fic family protein [Aquimarina sp. ERC-38]UZO81559.1 Fic family protein [Aquimarina sp. ERC-38]
MEPVTPWELTFLPIQEDLETKKVLKKLPGVHAALAELKGFAASIPNQSILINTLGLQEAKDSSAIENIITTHDDLYKSELQFNQIESLETKEVQNYKKALQVGFDLIKKNGLLTNATILKIQEALENNNAGYRKLPGTTLKNQKTKEVIYTPPQDKNKIVALMDNLQEFVNNNDLSDLDPIVKMAVIHFQFESIHPFYDGNGRTGRIINILYLITQQLLNLPILYLSNFIIKHKLDYYSLLQEVRETNHWENWLLFMLEGVEETAKDTVRLITDMKQLMASSKKQLRDNYKFYSQDLLNNLYRHPYTKIDFIAEDLKVSRLTAANYLNTLAKDGVLIKQKVGTANYYINQPLFNLLTQR